MDTETAADHPVTAPSPTLEQVKKADEVKSGEIESIPASKETQVKMPIVEESSKSRENPEEKQSETAAAEDVEEKSDKPIVNAVTDAPEEAPGHEALVSEKAKEQTEPASVEENEETAEDVTVESVPEGDKSTVEVQRASRSIEKKPEEQLTKAEAAGEKLEEAMKSMNDVPESSVETDENEQEILEATVVKEPEPEPVTEAEASQKEPAPKEILKGVTEATEIADVPKSKEELRSSAVEVPQSEMAEEQEASQAEKVEQEKPKEQSEAKEATGKLEKTLEASEVKELEPELMQKREASQVESTEKEKAMEESGTKETVGMPESPVQVADKPEKALDTTRAKETEKDEVKEKEDPQGESKEDEKPKEQSEAVKVVDAADSSSEANSNQEPEQKVVHEKEIPQVESVEDEELKSTPQVEEQSEAVKVANVVHSSAESNADKEPEQEVVQEKEISQAESIEDVELKSTSQVEESPEEQSEPTKTIGVVKLSIEATEKGDETLEANQVKETELEEVEKKEILQEPTAEAVEKGKETPDANAAKEPEQEVVKEREILQAAQVEELKQVPDSQGEEKLGEQSSELTKVVKEMGKETSDANAAKEPEQEAVKEREILPAEPVEELKQVPASQVDEKLEEQSSEPTKVIEVARKLPEATKKPEEISKGNQEKEPEQEERTGKETSHAEPAEEDKVEPVIGVGGKPKAAAEATEPMEETMEVNPSKELEQASLSKKEQDAAPQEENIPKEQSDATEVVEKGCEKVEPEEIQATGIENPVAQDGQEKSDEVQKPPVSESSEDVATTEKAAQAEQKEAAWQHSLAEAAEETTLEAKEKEVCPATQVQEIVKDVVGVAGQVEDEHETKDVKVQEEKPEKNHLTHVSAQQEVEKPKDESIPIPTTAKEVTKSSLGDIINRDVEVNPENKEGMEEKTSASVESKENMTVGEKLTEVAANDETKELEGTNAADFDTNRDKDVRELQNLESVTQDVDHTKEAQDQPKEDVPAKKHSNNILSKVKKSLAKATKALTGKSPQTKTTSSETKVDVKEK
ncbi:hypothetical protein Ancab_000496 [Ancistrocladus abbreviatus]